MPESVVLLGVLLAVAILIFKIAIGPRLDRADSRAREALERHAEAKGDRFEVADQSLFSAPLWEFRRGFDSREAADVLTGVRSGRRFTSFTLIGELLDAGADSPRYNWEHTAIVIWDCTAGALPEFLVMRRSNWIARLLPSQERWARNEGFMPVSFPIEVASFDRKYAVWGKVNGVAHLHRVFADEARQALAEALGQRVRSVYGEGGSLYTVGERNFYGGSLLTILKREVTAEDREQFLQESERVGALFESC